MKYATDFEIFLNTPDPQQARRLIDKYPFSGITCNPQMIAELKRPDYINVLKELREAAGDRKLFIQTPSNDYDGILRDVETILKVIGDRPSVIKIPTNSDGISAIMELSRQGIDVCGTQVMSSLQGILALQAGAKYVSVFYAMMLQGGLDNGGLYGGVDAKAVYDALTTYIDKYKCPGKIMACAPRTPDEISYLISTGAGSITLDPFDFDNCFASRHFQGIHQGVRKGWEEVYGDKPISQMLEEYKD